MKQEEQAFSEVTGVEMDIFKNGNSISLKEKETEETLVVDSELSSNLDLELPEENKSEKKEKHEDFDLTGFEAAVTRLIKRSSDTGVGYLINSPSGKRFEITSVVKSKLGNPDAVQIGYSKDTIAISKELGSKNTSYTLKKSGTKGVIYNAGLVKQITEYYNLDFSNRTSIAFSDVTYRTLNGNTVALIRVKC